MTDKLLVDRAKAAEILSICEGTLRLWWRKGTGPARVKLGARVLYRVADLERWILEHRETPMDKFSRSGSQNRRKGGGLREARVGKGAGPARLLSAPLDPSETETTPAVTGAA